VSVLLGNGDGSFQARVKFAVGDNPVSVAVADLDGDGAPDLITANVNSGFSLDGDVSVLLGNGDGSFQAAVSFLAGDNPVSVAVADLDGDSIPDLVTANLGALNAEFADVSVLLGNGDGSFQAAVSFLAGAFPARPNSVAIADLDGDSFPDVVTANDFSDDVSVLLGNGDGSFQTPIFFMAGDRTFFVAVADLDGDNRPDLVTANVNSDDVSVLINLPEPTSWLMLGTGIGFLGLLYRRRARGLRFC